MDNIELKSLQAPLKQQYHDDPESAVITLKANGRVGDVVTCSVDTGRAIAAASLHPVTGCDGTSHRTSDMLM